MKNKIRVFPLAARLTAGLFALLFVFCFLPRVRAAGSVYEPPQISTAHALIRNLDYDLTLYDKAGADLVYPAGFAKIMSAILFYEYLNNVVSPAPVTVLSSDDLSGGGIGLKADEVLEYTDLLNAFVVGSANDAGMVLARVVGGSVPLFVEKMNERAKELGAQNTHFENPTGLHNANARTTLADMFLICKSAYRIDAYMKASSLSLFDVPATNLTDKTRRLRNQNQLVINRASNTYYVKGTMGINLGYTAESGYCLCSVKEENGVANLLLLSGGSRDSSGENLTLTDAKTLFEYVGKAFTVETVLEKNAVVKEMPVALSSNQDHVLLVAASDVKAILPVGYNGQTDLENRITLSAETLSAPIVEGTSYGVCEIYYQGERIGSTELVAQQSVARSTSLFLLSGIENFLQLPAVRVVLIVLLILLLLLLVACLILITVQRWRQTGLSAKERRAIKQKQKALVRAEKNRQYNDFVALRRARRARKEAFLRDYQARMEEQRRRTARAAARPTAARRAPAPAEGSERTQTSKSAPVPQSPERPAPNPNPAPAPGAELRTPPPQYRREPK